MTATGIIGSEAIMTEREKELVMILDHPVYTVEFLEQWTKRNDNVFVNAPAALQAVAAKSYYEAVQRMASKEISV